MDFVRGTNVSALGPGFVAEVRDDCTVLLFIALNV